MKKGMAAFILCVVGMLGISPAGAVCAKSANPIKEVVTLNKKEQVVENRMIEALENLETRVDVEDCDVSQKNVSNAWYHLIYTRPEIFYKYQIMYWTVNGKMSYIEIKYANSLEKIRKQKEQVNKEVERFAAQVDDNWSDVEKALFLANYLCDNAYYTKKSFVREGAYNVLVQGKGMCDEYAKAYMLLGNRIGLNVRIVKSSKMNHDWNLVKIDGKYYHVDVTSMDNDDMNNLMNFLNSNKKILKTHKAYDMQAYALDGEKIKIGSKCDKLFKSSEKGRWSYAGGYWYTFNGKENAIKKYQFKNGAFRKVKVIDRWGTGGYYSSVSTYKGKVYYAKCDWFRDKKDEGVYCYNPSTGKKKLIVPYKQKKYDKPNQDEKGFGGIVIDKNGNLSALIYYPQGRYVKHRKVKKVKKLS